MIRGLYSAASGMFALERRQEALADNLANAQTPGYKKDDTLFRSFPNLLINRIRDYQEMQGSPAGMQLPGRPVRVGELSNGVYAQERVPSFQQGTFVQTDLPLDVAINDQALAIINVNGRTVRPAAFFTVQMPDGSVGYTRNGKWDLDSNGQLVTADGYKILGSDQRPIQINSSIAKEDVSITSDGRILLYPNQAGLTTNAGQIGIAVAQNPSQLVRAGGSVFKSDTPLQLAQNQGITLNQGFIEQSNVDLGQTMTDMMMMVRGYEANQKVISVYDKSLEQLSSVGRLNG